MIKIPETVRQLATNTPFIYFGLSERLFNLTQLAHYLRPAVETQCKKEVSTTAILSALSRLQRETLTDKSQDPHFSVENISVKSGLSTNTFYRSPEVRKAVFSLAENLHEEKKFFQYTESQHEITLFYERSALEKIQALNFKTKYENQKISCVGCQFDESDFHRPGLLFVLMQHISMHSVNIVEVTSTFTEFNFFIRDQDVKTVFETLHDAFLNKE